MITVGSQGSIIRGWMTAMENLRYSDVMNRPHDLRIKRQ